MVSRSSAVSASAGSNIRKNLRRPVDAPGTIPNRLQRFFYRPLRTIPVVLLVALAVAGCGSSDPEPVAPAPSSSSSSASPSKREREIYSQQRATCRTEQRFNAPEYREQDGAGDPRGYAEYAADHGFYKIRTDGEHRAAVRGCLAGLK